MDKAIKSIQDEITKVRKDLDFIKHVLSEDYELSDEAKKGLEEARRTPESEYIDL